MPFSASRAAMRREVGGSPEVQSTSVAPFFIVASTPVGPSNSDSTSRESGRQVTTTSASAAASAGEAAARTLYSAANADARSEVLFQTTRLGNAPATRAAIGR